MAATMRRSRPRTEGSRVSETERPQGDHSVWTAAMLATPTRKTSSPVIETQPFETQPLETQPLETQPLETQPLDTALSDTAGS